MTGTALTQTQKYHESDYELEEKLAVARRVCVRVAAGELVSDCLHIEGISPGAWWRWTEEYKYIRVEFDRARAAQAQSLAERAVRIARSVRGEDYNIVQATRLEIDTLKWYTSKIAPKLFGERIEVGGEGFRIGVIALPAERTSDGESVGLESGEDSK